MSWSCALRYSAFGGRKGPRPGWFKHEDFPGGERAGTGPVPTWSLNAPVSRRWRWT